MGMAAQVVAAVYVAPAGEAKEADDEPRRTARDEAFEPAEEAEEA